MSEKPKILFVPGLLCDTELWAYQINGLKPDFTSYVADLRFEDRIENMARTALNTVDGEFILCGLSMGGYVAMEIMRQAPDRVRKLVIMASSARSDSDEKVANRKALIELAQKGRFKGVTPKLLPLLIHRDRLDDAPLTRTVMQMAERVGRDAFFNQQTAIMHRIDSRPHLGKITKPTLVVCGRQDALTPPEHAEEIANLIPKAKLELIDGCGHLPPLERPQTTLKLLRAFLD